MIDLSLSCDHAFLWNTVYFEAWQKYVLWGLARHGISAQWYETKWDWRVGSCNFVALSLKLLYYRVVYFRIILSEWHDTLWNYTLWMYTYFASQVALPWKNGEFHCTCCLSLDCLDVLFCIAWLIISLHMLSVMWFC